jgi:chaperonin GroEL
VEGNAISQVATVSAGSDEEVGEMISEAMDKVTKTVSSPLRSPNPSTTELDVVEGMQFDRGYMSPYFVTDQERMVTELEGARILITDKKIGSIQDLVGGARAHCPRRVHPC